MAAGRVPKRADWRIADGVRVEELDGSWLALDPAGGIVYRLEARAAEVMRLVAHRLPLPGHLVPAARELAGHGVLEHPLVDRRTALVGAGVVTLTGLAATILPSAVSAASNELNPLVADWPVAGGNTVTTQDLSPRNYYVHAFTTSGTLTVRNAAAIRDVSILVVAGGGSGGAGNDGCGGGGGAGGVVHAIDNPAVGSSITILETGAYTVTVGDGGPARNNSGESGRGSNGFNSSVSGTGLTITVLGGGAGGGPSEAPSTGGSGGGGGGDDPNDTGVLGNAVEESGRANSWTGTGVKEYLGSNGGSGINGSAADRRGGGGGGAGGAASAATGAGGPGGAAVDLSDRYSEFGAAGTGYQAGGGWFAGGGGGSSLNTDEATRGAGGGGGAGRGGYDAAGNVSGQSGLANTGSGGGGAVRRAASNFGVSGAGGSGVVLVRYRLV